MVETFGTITAYHDIIDARYNLQQFVGRNWLIDEVIRFRDDKDRRSLVIVGEPGSGKSTFLAYLAEFWNCPRHFIRIDNIGGVTGVVPRAFLVSLGSQLFQKYGPDIFERGIAGSTQVTVGWTKDQAEVVGRFVDELYTLPFLPLQRDDVQVKVGVAMGDSKVLGERIKRLVDVTLALDELTLLHVTLINPLRKLQELHPTEMVIILVDALDESMYHAGTSILDVLPRSTDAAFPPNLRMVMTSRNGIHLSKFRPSDLLYLDDKMKGYWQANQQDIRSYIDKRLAEAPFAGMNATWKCEEVNDYVDQVVEHSQNNFLYLYYFFNELAANVVINQTDVRSFGIPKGLSEIYRSFAVEKIRRNTNSTIRITAAEEIPISLLAQLKTVPNVSAVELHDCDLLLTTTDSDQVTPLLIPLLLSSKVQIIKFQTQKAEQLGIWEEKYLPILGVMAVAYEALFRKQIADFAGVEVIYVDSVITQLKQFLNEVVYEQGSAYQFYHTSFSQYLLESRLNRDYPLDGPKYHYQIACYYRVGKDTWEEVNWETITDSYPFTYLTAHLEASGRGEELHHLLASETKQHQNAWYATKDSRGYIASYIADVNRARRLAETSYLPTDRTRAGQSIGLQSRYALITSSVNSLTQEIPPRLLYFLVERGIWTQQKGMTYARQVPDLIQSARAMVELLPFVGESEWEQWCKEVLAKIQAASKDDDEEKVDILLKFVSLYPDPKPEDFFLDILLQFLSLEEEKALQKALAGIEPHLPLSLLQYAVIIAQGSRVSATILAVLVHRLADSDPLRQRVFEDILAMVTKSDELVDRVAALEALITYQPTPKIKTIVQNHVYYARGRLSLDERYYQLEGRYILRNLLPYLSSSEQEQTLEELLISFQKQGVDEYSLVQLCSKLPVSLRERILLIAPQLMKGAQYYTYVLAHLAPYFEDEQQEKMLRGVIEAVRRSGEPNWLANEIGELVPKMSQTLLEQTLDLARHQWKDRWKARVLTNLAASFSGKERETVVKEALDAVLSISNIYESKEVLEQLAPLLTIPLTREALTAIQAIKDDYILISGLPELCISLPVSERERVWRRGLALTSTALGNPHEHRARLVSGMAPSLPEFLLPEALQVAQSIEKPASQVKALAALAPFLPQAERKATLEDALARLESMEEPFDKVGLFVLLIPLLPRPHREEVVQKALNEIDSLDDQIELKAPLLAQLAPFLPSDVREQVILEAITKPARLLRGRNVLQKLAPCLSEIMVRKLFLYLTFDDYGWSGRNSLSWIKLGFSVDTHEIENVLSALVIRLAELGNPTDAYKIVSERKWDSIGEKAETLGLLAPYLPGPLAEKALDVVLDLPNSPTVEYKQDLSEICIRLAKLGSENINIVSLAQKIADPFLQAKILASYACSVEERQSDRVLQAALDTAQKIDSTYVKQYCEILMSLSPQLVKQSSSSLYEIWQGIFTQSSRRGRQYLVPVLYCLTPVLGTLGGTEALVEVLHALEDVYRWWP